MVLSAAITASTARSASARARSWGSRPLLGNCLLVTSYCAMTAVTALIRSSRLACACCTSSLLVRHQSERDSACATPTRVPHKTLDHRAFSPCRDDGAFQERHQAKAHRALSASSIPERAFSVVVIAGDLHKLRADCVCLRRPYAGRAHKPCTFDPGRDERMPIPQAATISARAADRRA